MGGSGQPVPATAAAVSSTRSPALGTAPIAPQPPKPPTRNISAAAHQEYAQWYRYPTCVNIRVSLQSGSFSNAFRTTRYPTVNLLFQRGSQLAPAGAARNCPLPAAPCGNSQPRTLDFSPQRSFPAVRLRNYPPPSEMASLLLLLLLSLLPLPPLTCNELSREGEWAARGAVSSSRARRRTALLLCSESDVRAHTVAGASWEESANASSASTGAALGAAGGVRPRSRQDPRAMPNSASLCASKQSQNVRGAERTLGGERFRRDECCTCMRVSFLAASIPVYTYFITLYTYSTYQA